MIRHKYLLISMLFVCLNIFGQQDEQWSHYFFNQQYYNPGFSGVEEISRATLIHRSQWLGYEATIVDDRAGGAPLQQNLSLTQPLRIGSKKINSGVGLTLNNDQLGPFRKWDTKLDLAYHYRPYFGGVFGFGVRASFESLSIDGSLLRERDENDPVVEAFGSEKSSQIKPNMGAGIYYNSPVFFASLAVHDFFENSIDFNTNSDSVNFTFDRSIWFSTGYNFLVDDFTITPSLHSKSDFYSGSMNFGVLANYNNFKYWLGINTRTSMAYQSVDSRRPSVDDVNFLVGIGLLSQNALRIGYAFDLVLSGQSAKSQTSHEIMLSYAVSLLNDKRRTPIKDPRYNFD